MKILCVDRSPWGLMDMKRMRPVKVPPLLLEKYGSDEPLEMEYAPRKIRERCGPAVLCASPTRQSAWRRSSPICAMRYLSDAIIYS